MGFPNGINQSFTQDCHAGVYRRVALLPQPGESEPVERLRQEDPIERRGALIMATSSLLSTLFSLLFLIVACFYLFRLAHSPIWIHHVDAENEVGHGMMAIGMVFMLAPAGWLSPDIIRWNIVLFAASSLWWIVRLFTHKPLLALVFGKNEVHSTAQADAIHVFMHGGMCYMFLLMSSMALSMTSPATYLNCLFFVSFAFLTLFYGRESAKDLQTAKRDWLQSGANLAHMLMSGMMCWMFLEMISMTMNMGVR
jgi:hypothetical protein